MPSERAEDKTSSAFFITLICEKLAMLKSANNATKVNSYKIKRKTCKFI